MWWDGLKTKRITHICSRGILSVNPRSSSSFLTTGSNRRVLCILAGTRTLARGAFCVLHGGLVSCFSRLLLRSDDDNVILGSDNSAHSSGLRKIKFNSSLRNSSTKRSPEVMRRTPIAKV
jgi:hypothetical protein